MGSKLFDIFVDGNFVCRTTELLAWFMLNNYLINFVQPIGNINIEIKEVSK